MTKEQAAHFAALRPISPTEWIETIVSRPGTFDTYVNDRDNLAAVEKWRRANGCEIPSEAVINQFHQTFRGSINEDSAWFALFHVFSGPVPDPIAHDLIDRTAAIDVLGHGEHSDAIMKRLIPLVDEALLTSVKLRYIDPKYSTKDFAEWTEPYQTHQWLLQSLEVWEASSPDKEAIAKQWAQTHRIPSKLGKHRPDWRIDSE